MRLTAIVCTRNRYSLLEKTLASLIAQTNIVGRLDVIVVDNSTDIANFEVFSSRYASIENVRFVYSSSAGLSQARNLGTSLATGDFVAFIDDDAVAHPSWAESLLDAFRIFGDRTGIVGGPVRPIWEVELPFCLTPSFRDLYSIVDRGNTIRELGEREWLAGCNIAFERAALEAAGGFAVALGRTGNAAALLSNEETAVCAAIRQAGKVMVYAPNAAVDHFIPADRSNAEWLIRRIAWQSVSDALSDPERSAAHSRWLTSERRWRKRIVRALAWIRFWRRYRKGLRDEDFRLIYDAVAEMLCVGL